MRVENLEKFVERMAGFAAERKAEEGVDDDVVGHDQRLGLDVVHLEKLDAQRLELRDESLVDGFWGALGVTHLDVVAEVVQVAPGDESVAAVVARASHDEDAAMGARGVHLRDGARDGQARQFHELIDAETVRGAHELLVDATRLVRADVRGRARGGGSHRDGRGAPARDRHAGGGRLGTADRGKGAGAARGARDATVEETSRNVDRERPRGEHSGPRRAARVLRQRPVATRPGCPTGKCRKISESALLWNP